MATCPSDNAPRGSTTVQVHSKSEVREPDPQRAEWVELATRIQTLGLDDHVRFNRLVKRYDFPRNFLNDRSSPLEKLREFKAELER